MSTASDAAPNDATPKGAIPNADHLDDDAFGYSCYALVLPADEEMTALTNRIEAASGMTRAKIPAHITVKGTFYGIDSLEEVQRRVQGITAETPAFDIPLAGAESRWGETGGGLRVRVIPALQSLHDALVAAIAPLGKPAYQDDPYRPHMTYVQDVTPEGLAKAKAQVAATDFGPVFRARYVDLMGRVGKAHGGRWTRIARFPLAG
jgi:2'-5' RNA ligase